MSPYRMPWGPLQVVHVVDVLQVHGDPLEPVGQLAADWLAVHASTLLEVGELADFEPIEPHLPTQAPCAERRRLPVVLDEADVVAVWVGPEGAQRLEVEVLDVERRRLEDHLVLVELLQPVWVLTVAAVGGAATRLDVRDVPRLGADSPQERVRVEGARSDLGVVWLND